LKATSRFVIVKFSTRPKFIPTPNTKFVHLEEFGLRIDVPHHSMYQHAKVSRKNIIANSGLQRVCEKITPTAAVGDMSRPRASSMDVHHFMTTKKISETVDYSNTQEINHRSTQDYGFYCIDCFADTESECICNRIVGYDAMTGYPVVDITDEEWAYLNNQNIREAGDT
jgi:hypothetical protein